MLKTSAPNPDEALSKSDEFAQGQGYALPEYPFVAPPELSTGQRHRYPVVIVGGGITGLTLACSLARLGVQAVLLDEDNTVGFKGASSQGICYTQKSLEIFDKLGIYPAIAKKGIQWNVGRTFAGDEEVYSFDLRQQSSLNLSAQPPFINIQQFYIESYLVERIHALGQVDLRWKSRVSAFEQNTDFATLTVETPAGSYQLEADHVIDASGAHTPFHQWVGATQQSQPGDDRWCIADVRFSAPLPAERHTWIEAPFNENRAVWQHLMADNVWRLDYQLAPNADPDAMSSPTHVRARLQRQFGDDVAFEIVWVGPYASRSQCLDQLRVGRVFFMGDTAKVVSPFGARGGNTGVADADNLAWKLAAVLRGRASPALLDSYNEERLEAAQQNVRVTHRTTRFLRPANDVERSFRNAAISLARQHLFARALVNTGRMAVANTYTQSHICDATGGQSVPNAAFCWADGSQGTVNDLLLWAEGDLLVLVFGQLSAGAVQRLKQLALHAPVRSVQVLGQGERPQAREHVRDLNARGIGHLQGACHVFGHAWALVRPDAYLAATGEAVDSDLIAAVEKTLGLH